MTQKIAPGVIHDETHAHVGHPDAEAIEHMRARRDASRWSIGIGVGLMFMGSFSSALTVGGALMVLGGFVSSLYYGRKLRALEGDPWEADHELDSWEEEQLKES